MGPQYTVQYSHSLSLSDVTHVLPSQRHYYNHLLGRGLYMNQLLNKS